MIYPINQNDPREQILALEEMFVDAVEKTIVTKADFDDKVFVIKAILSINHPSMDIRKKFRQDEGNVKRLAQLRDKLGKVGMEKLIEKVKQFIETELA